MHRDPQQPTDTRRHAGASSSTPRQQQQRQQQLPAPTASAPAAAAVACLQLVGPQAEEVVDVAHHAHPRRLGAEDEGQRLAVALAHGHKLYAHRGAAAGKGECLQAGEGRERRGSSH